MFLKDLTEEQKSFIRKNYLVMREADLAAKTGLTINNLKKYKRRNGLLCRRSGEVNNVVVMEGVFNVDEKENWVA